jgi:hypothetical protein
MTSTRRIACLTVFAAALVISACTGPSHEAILAKDWVAPQFVPARTSIYCYRTLAAPDCQYKPEPGQENRLVSYDGDDYASPPR